MGLFDFIKDVGKALTGKGNEAKEIQELVTKELGEKIENFRVEFDDGVVTMYGAADSQATKEKAILLAGNVKGVANVNDENLTAPPAEEPVQFYTIKSGDTLSKIAKEYYGDAMKYPVIFEANREVIKDPNLIYPGQQIRIPKL